jgi:hypothetical protein
MNIVVIFQRLKKFPNTSSFLVAQIRKAFREVAELARDNVPSICRQPLRNCMQVASLTDETRPNRALRNIVVLFVRKRFDILGTRLDRRRFDIRGLVCMMRFDQADVIEEKLVTAGRAELAALLEKDANFRSGPVVVVGQDLNYHRHLVRRVTFEDNMFHHEFVVADPGTFFDRALDHIAGNAGFTRFVDHGREPGICGGLSSAELCRHHDFFHKFSDELAFFQPGDFSFGVEPLATHREGLTVAARISKRGSVRLGRARLCRAAGGCRGHPFGSTESRPTKPESIAKQKERRSADDPDGNEGDVVLYEVGIRHQGKTEEHRFPDVHPLPVNKCDEADRAEDQSADKI